MLRSQYADSLYSEIKKGGGCVPVALRGRPSVRGYALLRLAFAASIASESFL